MKETISMSSVMHFIELFHNNSLTRHIRQKESYKTNTTAQHKQLYIKEVNSKQLHEIIRASSQVKFKSINFSCNDFDCSVVSGKYVMVHYNFFQFILNLFNYFPFIKSLKFILLDYQKSCFLIV